jgi:hypothetical protein
VLLGGTYNGAFENSVLKRIFGPMKNEVNGQIRDMYSLPSIIRMIKARRVRRAGHVARIGEKRNAYRLFVGKPEERVH